jgi:hypothetical protein
VAVGTSRSCGAGGGESSWVVETNDKVGDEVNGDDVMGEELRDERGVGLTADRVGECLPVGKSG